MKVLQINTVVSYGSTGRICRGIADILTENGHECIIAYGRGENVQNYKTIKIGNNWDNYFHFIKSYVLNRHGFGSKKATKELIYKIEEIEPDIIQLHNVHGYYLNIKVLFEYLKQKNIPVVWLLHDQWSYSGGPASFVWSKNEEISRKDFVGTESEYPKTLNRIFIDKNLKDKLNLILDLENINIVTPSKWLEKLVKKTFLKKFPVRTIYNGIDLNVFYPRESKLRDKYDIKDKIILLSVANEWTASKGLNFLRKLPNLLEKKFQLVMIGVDKRTKNLLSEKIITIDRTNNISELADWYSTADAFVNPTLFDNFPSVNIESLACGTPVITFNTGGAIEQINSENGEVVEYGNEKEMIEKIKKISKKTENIINKCRSSAYKYDRNLVYKQYIDLYEYINNK